LGYLAADASMAGSAAQIDGDLCECAGRDRTDVFRYLSSHVCGAHICRSSFSAFRRDGSPHAAVAGSQHLPGGVWTGFPALPDGVAWNPRIEPWWTLASGARWIAAVLTVDGARHEARLYRDGQLLRQQSFPSRQRALFRADRLRQRLEDRAVRDRPAGVQG
jgi:hypothetical protein